ncbi:hypothetical protein V6N13_073758 [Hibiscus sabdariffa]
MATVCNTSQVKDRLQTWGLNDVTVKYMGGCKFLIDIKDQELSSRLQIQEWAILKEIWTDLFHLPERITWIQKNCGFLGVPNLIGRKCLTIFRLRNRAPSLNRHVPRRLLTTLRNPHRIFLHIPFTPPLRPTTLGEDEVTKAICLKKASLIDVYSTDINERRSLGEKDFLGNAQSVELPLQNHLEIPISMQVFNSPKELGPPALLKSPNGQMG